MSFGDWCLFFFPASSCHGFLGHEVVHPPLGSPQAWLSHAPWVGLSSQIPWYCRQHWNSDRGVCHTPDKSNCTRSVSILYTHSHICHRSSNLGRSDLSLWGSHRTNDTYIQAGWEKRAHGICRRNRNVILSTFYKVWYHMAHIFIIIQQIKRLLIIKKTVMPQNSM